jgi:hypothetical protein
MTVQRKRALRSTTRTITEFIMMARGSPQRA